jgi:hypothetical protein
VRGREREMRKENRENPAVVGWWSRAKCGIDTRSATKQRSATIQARLVLVFSLHGSDDSFGSTMRSGR